MLSGVFRGLFESLLSEVFYAYRGCVVGSQINIVVAHGFDIGFLDEVSNLVEVGVTVEPESGESAVVVGIEGRACAGIALPGGSVLLAVVDSAQRSLGDADGTGGFFEACQRKSCSHAIIPVARGDDFFVIRISGSEPMVLRTVECGVAAVFVFYGVPIRSRA